MIDESDIDLKEGTLIIIPAGTIIKSMRPSQEPRTRKRTGKIKLHSFSAYTAELTWAGPDKYWNWCEINEKIINANPEIATELNKILKKSKQAHAPAWI